ncbi:MAG: Regulator of RpoS [Verrucomicrobiae bacterium]|nr:Regulator of RpoS [Verrucomicrobiae bacterium]
METMLNPAPTETATTTAPESATPRTCVLAIDDNTDFLQLLKDLLEPCGYEVHTAINPVKALEVFQRDKDKYKLVLLDYYMPQLDGAKTFEWLRKISPNVKVIVCSGADELRLRQIQAQHKINAYIHKPFRVKEALETISRVNRQPVHGSN